MIKQKLTPERMEHVKSSMQKMMILSQIMLFENQENIDVDYRIPNLNNFAKRIVQDTNAIQRAIKNNGRMLVNVADTDFAEDYAGEILKVINILCGLDYEIIKEFADNLENEFKQIMA